MDVRVRASQVYRLANAPVRADEVQLAPAVFGARIFLAPIARLPRRSD
jgi:hypothetical protein